MRAHHAARATIFVLTLGLIGCPSRTERPTAQASPQYRSPSERLPWVTDQLTWQEVRRAVESQSTALGCPDPLDRFDVEVGDPSRPPIDVACGDCAGAECVGCLRSMIEGSGFLDPNDPCLGGGQPPTNGTPPPDGCPQDEWDFCISVRTMDLEMEGLILPDSIPGQAHCECEELLDCKKPGTPKRCLERLWRGPLFRLRGAKASGTK